ncbi:MAG: response regulator [Gammaproteobacteria bacterium]|jgi:DNA-binding response OmpR family regulator|nr:response regulator [Gammaproteobacteria bacterium]MBT3490274.1 response regulator [Gammaproteobacteria bacterium]MBT3719289.1 response regulator [Gammaproteobacteria bacterium]MBT3845526.1 response regulator [Gammaproteobacteria bacterium]MBT3893368.1 response regulator [Gammaproteobacteria bacterium]
MDRPKILIVDDDESVRLLLTTTLRPHASEVIELENGLHVLETLVAEEADLLITDLLMDGKEGLETITEVRGQFSTLPIFAISASRDFLEIASDLGADEIFAKPMDLVRMVHSIQNL